MRYDKTIKADNALRKTVKGILIGTFISILFSIILLILFSLSFIKMKNIPSMAIMPMVMLICALSAFVSGYFSVRVIKENGMVNGIIAGLVMFIFMFFSWLIFNREPFTTIILVKVTLMLLMGAIGGIVGVNKRNR